MEPPVGSLRPSIRILRTAEWEKREAASVRLKPVSRRPQYYDDVFARGAWMRATGLKEIPHASALSAPR